MSNEGKPSEFLLMNNPLMRGPLTTDTRLRELQKRFEEKYNLKFENYLDFHKWSCDNYPKLWEETWNFLDIVCSKSYDEVIDETTAFKDVPEWFRGAELNYAENVLRYPDDDHVAIIAIGEERETPENVTVRQLREEVALLSSAFRNAGIKHMDVIVAFISNRKEAIVALLAAASVGAMFSAVNPLMGPNAVMSRFQQISPKILFSNDRYRYDKKENNVFEILPDIVKGLPTLEHVIIVPSNDKSLTKDISFIPNSIFLPDFLKLGLTQDGRIPPAKYDQLSFSHPMTITFTSGTTGQPKGIVHSAGGYLLCTLLTMDIHLNIKKSDIILGMYSTGWVTWNIFITSMGLGATIVVYEGWPFYQSPTSYWDIIDRHKVTFSFTTPSVLEEYEKRNYLPGPHNTLESLHTLCTGSCRVKGHTYDFVYQKIKPGIYFSEVFGSTEFMTMFAGFNAGFPVYKEEIQCMTPGVQICSYNDEGKPVLDEKGEFVITTPFPTMPLYFWNDESRTKYKAFFSKFPGVWCHGDTCAISSRTGGMAIFGRSDETIKQRGARFGSADIYNIMNLLPEVSDSLCVSKITKSGDEIAILFVCMKEGNALDSKMIEAIRKKIGSELSSRYVPEVILSASAVPYNLNLKKMEVVVKKILAGEKVNTENVTNPECLSYYYEASKIDIA